MKNYSEPTVLIPGNTAADQQQQQHSHGLRERFKRMSVGWNTFTKPTPARHRRNAITPQMEDVIRSSVKMEPWTLNTFLDFLEQEKSSENLHFFEECEALRAYKKIPNAVDPPQDILLLSKQMLHENEGQWLNELIQMYIVENASNQINVSASQREALLKQAANSIPQGKADPEILRDAQREVQLLMSQDAWPRFVRAAMTQNITVEVTMKRKVLGKMLAFATTMLLASLVGTYVPRDFLLLLFFPWFVVFYTLFSGHAKQCFFGAFFSNKTNINGKHVAIQCRNTQDAQKHHAILGLMAVTGAAACVTLMGVMLSYAWEQGIPLSYIYI